MVLEYVIYMLLSEVIIVLMLLFLLDSGIRMIRFASWIKQMNCIDEKFAFHLN